MKTTIRTLTLATVALTMILTSCNKEPLEGPKRGNGSFNPAEYTFNSLQDCINAKIQYGVDEECNCYYYYPNDILRMEWDD